ncbi:hypothetical protein PACTADRAFT_45248 [Pachysolen tannophilus NRRL Y-2460]|uniref:Major facilitator superfamily (MFS) profile domain-containing protein n=1 Tax=Pachysolen tannophilus NRRL Y-2460 TaxID=669874 RepID=A0A1E4TR48_PACTA|nr:hypothetical protein PACTADRAFT_45248 [Pachysolen tannophilus NRRL Y-2460]
MDSGSGNGSGSDSDSSGDLSDNEENNNNNNDYQVQNIVTDFGNDIVRTRSDNASVQQSIANTYDSNNTANQRWAKVPYSALTGKEKAFIVTLCSCIGLWSSIAMPIYFPILTVLQKKFDVSSELINISVVCYLIFQGLGPTFSSNLADTLGRRPVIIMSLSVYIAANIGLAVSDAYWLILVLRCVQAAGIAPVIAINSGVVGDITQKHERGSYIGIMGGVTLVGQGFGALIGAVIAQSSFGWRGIFWFLAISAGVMLICAIIFLPETKRTMVGNVTVKPKRFVNRAPILKLPYFQKQFYANQQYESLEKSVTKFDAIATFKIIILPEVFCSLFPAALIFTSWTMGLTTLTSVLADDYGYETLDIGLFYLPCGVATLVGSLTCGKILDFFYRREKKAFRLKQQQNKIPKDRKLNIIKARLNLFIYPSSLCAASLLVFGWTIYAHTNVSAIIISTFFMAFACMFPMTMCTTVLVDLFPERSATSTSAVNLLRCWTGAVFVAALSKMIARMTTGGCYTFMAALCMLGNILIYLVVHRGETWIENRKKRERARASEKEQQQQEQQQQQQEQEQQQQQQEQEQQQEMRAQEEERKVEDALTHSDH